MKKITLSAIIIITSIISVQAQTLNPTSVINTPNAADSFKGGYTFSYTGAGTPWNGALISFGGAGNGYDCQISSDYGPNGGNHLSFRTHNGDPSSNNWNSWNEIWHSGNLNNINSDFFAKKLTLKESINLNSGLTNSSPRPPVTNKTLLNGEINGYGSSNPLADDGFLRLSAGGGTNNIRSYIDLSGYSTQPDMYGNIVMGTWGTERMRINSDGNVGIGTKNPLQKFVVSNEGAEGFEVYLDKPQNIVGLQSYNRSLNSLSKMQLEASQFSFMSGNVGIGTTNPTAKLTVAGDINSREVRVTVNAGADFVFENDYDLPSLTSVETFIKENKHLPEIASAKEMQENGINLSEMNIKLLQKIEELTLYTIEQNKEIQKQNNKILILEEKVKKIESTKL